MTIVIDMALEQITQDEWLFMPGPADVHTHPRVFDSITNDGFVAINQGQEGKAGLRNYSEVALKSGITAMIAMPNEQLRRFDVSTAEQTELVSWPIATHDRVLAMESAISQNSYIPTGIHMGIDPTTAFRDEKKNYVDKEYLEEQFSAVSDECTSLKIYLAETTGGNNIAVEHATEVTDIWNGINHDKPIVLHVEGADVATVFEDLGKRKWGKDAPIHIAHVSSRQELEAVIQAKQDGMNVTCEVTPHHLFLDAEARQELGGYGCMKPSLKPKEDMEFLWANIDQIDMFASDCAPHRRSDKEADNPAFGVTNHTVLLPLLFGALKDGRLTAEQLDKKLSTNPRHRFNLPDDDDSQVRYNTGSQSIPPSVYERRANTKYGYNAFARQALQRKLHYAGRVVSARAGVSTFDEESSDRLEVSYTHLIRPANRKAKTSD